MSKTTWYAALLGVCRAGAQKNSPKSGRGLGHVTPTVLAVRSAILATAWLLVNVLVYIGGKIR